MKPDSVRNNLLPTWLTGSTVLLVLLLAGTGCTGNPPRQSPSAFPPEQPPAPDTVQSAGDTALLAAVAGLHDGERTALDGYVLEVGSRYTAASGYDCRQVRFLDSANRPLAAQRLVCRSGEQVFIAPDVFTVTPGTSE